MSRLIALGCSYTYGHGLPDCHVPPNKPGPKPSKLSWAFILAQKLNLDLVNLAQVGVSNLHILWHLLNFDFEEDDTCIIMWTHFHRHPKSLLNYDSSIMRWTEYEKINFSDIVSIEDENLSLTNFISIHHAHLYLKEKKIKHNFLILTHPENKLPIPSVLDIPLILRYKKFTSFDKALDNSHPGIKSHELLAKLIYKEMNVLR